MLPPTPLSLLCAVLLCLPLAAIFTFTTPSTTTTTTTTTTTSSGAAATSPLPITVVTSTEKYPEPTLLPLPRHETQPQIKINQSRITNAIYKSKLPPPLKIQLGLLAQDEEADDQSLFSLASRVDPAPKPTATKKLAFMFLTTSPLPFAPLWELYFTRVPKNLYNIYVHADPSTFNYTTQPFRGVFAGRVIPSKPTRRHSPTLISAARRLISHALLHDASNSMFALLSPSCIPIRSFNYTYRSLIKSRKSFIEILKNEPGAYERWAARGEDAMSPEVEYNDFRIGSQFWVVKRKHARIIVRDRRVWSKFKLPCLREDTCYPEEHYFPTVVSMVDPGGCIPCTLTHVDWNGSHGGHPRMYETGQVGPELIWTLRLDKPRYGTDGSSNSSSASVRKRHDPFLFARKFSPASLHRLISIAKDVIFKD